jgi:hypothetical protein
MTAHTGERGTWIDLGKPPEPDCRRVGASRRYTAGGVMFNALRCGMGSSCRSESPYAPLRQAEAGRPDAALPAMDVANVQDVESGPDPTSALPRPELMASGYDLGVVNQAMAEEGILNVSDSEATAIQNALVERVHRWAEVFSEAYPREAIAEGKLLSDLSACLADCARAIVMPACVMSVEPACRALRSAHLLQAIQNARAHVMETSDGRTVAPDLDCVIRLEIFYLAVLRKACLTGAIEPGSVLRLLLGHAGRASVLPPGAASDMPAPDCPQVPSFAHYLLSVNDLEPHTAFEFAGTLDAAFRSGHWRDGVDAEREAWRRNLLFAKGYGARGSNNFYSALVLTDVRYHKLVLASALMRQGLIPTSAECHEKRSGQRGRELARTLLRSCGAVPWDWSDSQSAAWLSDALDGAFSDAVIVSMRERHLAAGRERARRAHALYWNMGATGLGP